MKEEVGEKSSKVSFKMYSKPEHGMLSMGQAGSSPKMRLKT